MAVKKTIFAVVLVIISAISIAISAWQFQNDNGDIELTSGSLTSDCKKFPLNYVRPFQISLSGKDKPGYCGYGVANTAFRLAVACLTFIIGALLPFDLVKVSNEILYWAFFTLGVLWYSATVSDCTALANSTQACKDSWEDYSNVSCENDIYGVTIAVDFVGSVSVLLCWVLCDGVSMLVPPALSQKDAASNQA